MQDYKPEITFLIDRQAKIYYHKIDLFHKHEDLLEENKLDENNVCRLVYDPNEKDYQCNLLGIPGISASCNVLYEALPFELKSTHCTAIENFIKEYDSIVAYSKEHEDEYDWSDPEKLLRDRVKLINVLAQVGLHDYPQTEEEKEIDSYLKEEKERKELLEKQEKQLEDIASICSTEVIEKKIDETKTNVTYKYSVDLARFLELTQREIVLSGEIASQYWTIATQIVYGLVVRIANRACELQDPELLECLKRLKMVEEDTTKGE